MIFPFEQFWHLYLWFSGAVLVVVLLDLGVFHRTAHVVTVRESLRWSAIWVGVALLVAGAMWGLAFSATGDPAIARQVLLEYLTGYVVEKSLAVDNIFVFVVLFGAFRIPLHLQHRVLVLGVLSALVFRALCIAGAAQLMQYHGVLIAFGILLILSGLKMAFLQTHPVPAEAEEAPDGKLTRTLKRWIPYTPELHGSRFFVREGGRWLATPLLLALLAIEISDVVFAFDSIPAIFAITREPFIVFSSNMMAILGLRSMYFLLADAADRFTYLRYGLAAVLVFVGAKMAFLNELFERGFPVTLSLGIIALLLGTSIAASLWQGRRGHGEKGVGSHTPGSGLHSPPHAG